MNKVYCQCIYCLQDIYQGESCYEFDDGTIHNHCLQGYADKYTMVAGEEYE